MTPRVRAQLKYWDLPWNGVALPGTGMQNVNAGAFRQARVAQKCQKYIERRNAFNKDLTDFAGLG